MFEGPGRHSWAPFIPCCRPCLPLMILAPVLPVLSINWSSQTYISDPDSFMPYQFFWKNFFLGVNSRSWWWTGRPGMLQSMGSQRVGHDWTTVLNWTEPDYLSLLLNFAMQETRVWFLGWEDPLEKEMATQSNILAWRIPWTEETGSLHSWGCKESDMTERPTHTKLLLTITSLF